MTNEPRDDGAAADSDENSSVEQAAAQGPLPGAEEAEEAAERGEDHSDTEDADTKAEEIGGGDVAGGINMR
jgi:hypothetical protein